ncbi:hypothetical protein GGR53DRAFT_143265 [Hypoxylon sp. FL1150]|nr:hypothetical protein GGR53DRAFT_143265 [Hypoxylon sp. FL1150]
MQSKSLIAFLSALAFTSASPLRRRCSNSTVPTLTNPTTPPATIANTHPTPTPPAATHPAAIANTHRIPSAATHPAATASTSSATISATHPAAIASTSSATVSTASSAATATTSSAAIVPALPTTGSGTQLAGPDGATLKHILVGHGIQNYTCTAANATATSIGALAVLWDITDLYPGLSSSSLSAADFDALTSKVLRTTAMPLNMATDSVGAVVASPFPAPADLTIQGLSSPVKFLGHHFFDSANTPTFDLSGANDGEFFSGVKNASVSAPSDADPGVDPDTGAVAWLRLTDKGTSTGVSLVYRVVTAGGDAETCAGAGVSQSIPYAAQYWIYDA